MSDPSGFKSIVMQIVKFVGCMGTLAGIVVIIWILAGYGMKLSNSSNVNTTSSGGSDQQDTDDVEASSSYDNSAGSTV